MDLIFANPAGFWALLGIPAVLAIHFLQRQSRIVTISTLFLLEQMRRESVSGKRFERLRSSIPLWLQLLVVLLLTWMLADPRWIRKDAVQRIAIVMDGSASMQVFRDEAIAKLDYQLTRLGRTVHQTEYVALDSRLVSETLYNGTSLPGLLAALREWEPMGGDHDFAPALRVARSLVGAEGLVTLVSDHPAGELAYNGRLLAVGHPVDNCGFAGVSIERNEDGQMIWKALVRNYADTPQTRDWFIQSGQQRSSERSITLEPRQMRALQGPFPEDADRAMLVLKTDAFPADDVLPMVRPVPKPIVLAKNTDPKLDRDIDPILRSFENVTLPGSGAPADIVFSGYQPLNPSLPDLNAVVFIEHPVQAKQFISGNIVAENHPFMEGLNWQGLICRDSPRLPLTQFDEVILWQGDRPMIILRVAEGRRQLLLNFDLASSNAPRLPAFIVLVHRFVEDYRATKVAEEQANFETAQRISLACAGGEDAPDLILTSLSQGVENKTTIPLAQALTLRAPEVPGFFTVHQGEQLLLKSAAFFADTREADFSEAAEEDQVSAMASQLAERHTESDDNWQMWILIAAVVLLMSWYFVSRPVTAGASTETPQPAPPAP